MQGIGDGDALLDLGPGVPPGLTRTASGGFGGVLPPAPTGLARRASAPARGAFGGGLGGGSGDSGGGESRGLPVHFLHSGPKRRSKRERVLCSGALAAVAALLATLYVLVALARAHHTQRKHLQTHYEGWTVSGDAFRVATR